MISAFGHSSSSNLKDERKLSKNPIQVISKAPRDKLHPGSRINYGKIYTVEHNVKVLFIGKLAKESERTLMTDFDATWSKGTSLSQPLPIQSSNKPHRTRHDQDYEHESEAEESAQMSQNSRGAFAPKSMEGVSSESLCSSESGSSKGTKVTSSPSSLSEIPNSMDFDLEFSSGLLLARKSENIQEHETRAEADYFLPQPPFQADYSLKAPFNPNQDDERTEEGEVRLSGTEPYSSPYETMRRGIRDYLLRYHFQPGSPSSKSGHKKVFYNITWELPLFISFHFKPQEALKAALTISGGPVDAYATTCEEYLTRWWGKLGQLLLLSVQGLLDNSKQGR
jgi:hypothetical protein